MKPYENIFLCTSLLLALTAMPVVAQVTPQIYSQQIKLVAPDGAQEDWFGRPAVLDEDTAVVASLWADTPTLDAGAAYVFVRRAGQWVQQAKLTASDGETGDAFGFRLALEGNTLLVGASGDDDAATDAGAVYIFVRQGESWIEQAKLVPGDGQVEDWFGYRVSLSGDTAAISSWSDDLGDRAGAVYVFVRNGESWTQQAKLLASDGFLHDQFGQGVDIDGDTILVGAPFHDDNITNSGAAYVFVRSGETWTEQGHLFAADPQQDSYYGLNTALDGDTGVVGATHSVDLGPNTGAAYVYERNADQWQQSTKLMASDGSSDHFFGEGIALEGNQLLIGAWGDDANGQNAGSAYLFARDGQNWVETHKFLASDGAADDWFGADLSISGNTVLISADHDDDQGLNSGSVYIFQDPLVPDIRANGSDGPLLLGLADPVQITVALIPGYMLDRRTDWWAGALTPYGTYWVNPAQRWVKSDRPISAGQYPAFDLVTTPLLDRALPVGIYGFFLALDENADGLFDLHWYDYVDVISSDVGTGKIAANRDLRSEFLQQAQRWIGR